MAGEDAFFQTHHRPGLWVPTKVFTEFREMVLDVQPVLVVIDGRTDTFAGNENDRRDAIQYINARRSLAREFGGAIVVLQHPSQIRIWTWLLLGFPGQR